MTSADTFARLSAGLAEGVRHTDGLVGLMLLGSASEQAAHRRDQWSDHDFFALAEPGAGARVRESLGWLPEQERIVLTAREGALGFVALYDDGHVLEFAVAEPGELAGAVVGDATIAVDDAAGSAAALTASGQERAARADGFDPANDVRLVLVKVLIGVGRARRGELLTAGEFVRTWAVQHLVRAVRGRFAHSSSTLRDTIDPVRRFERDFPEFGERLAALLAQPVEPAARDLLAFTREALEPDWPGFPSAAAEVVTARLGW